MSAHKLCGGSPDREFNDENDCVYDFLRHAEIGMFDGCLQQKDKSAGNEHHSMPGIAPNGHCTD